MRFNAMKKKNQGLHVYAQFDLEFIYKLINLSRVASTEINSSIIINVEVFTMRVLILFKTKEITCNINIF